MAKNNIPDDTSESAEVESRIDQMMDPKIPDKPTDKSSLKGAPDLPEIDIFKDKPELVQSEEQSPEKPKSAAKQDAAKEEKREAEPVEGESDPSDAIVDDIVSHEGDELLAAQDAEVSKAFVGTKPAFTDRIRDFFSSWWENKIARYATLTVLLALIAAAMIIPTSRYAVLSTVGVRSSASVTILDSTTTLPLKNVSVTIGGSSAKSNSDGVVRFKGLRLGKKHMTIQQLGFAPIDQTVTLGLGSNPLGEFQLKAVGTQYKFEVTDYISGKPVTSAEADSDEANAQANTKGEIILTIGKITSPTIDVTLTAGNYRTEKVTIQADTKTPTNVVMVTNRKEVFISNQSGKYDLYKVDADGKNRQLLLAATGTERPQITLAPHPTANMVALVSSRDNKRNQDGYLLDTLTLVNIDTGAPLQLDQSEKIQVIDWIKNKLIYVKVKAGTSAGNPERYQLMSYDYGTTTRLQLATANNFADIVSAKGVLYYATANYYTPGQSQFVRINPDGTGKQVLLNDQVWNIIRTNYDDLYLAGTYEGNTQTWYSYHLGDSSTNKLPQAPADANTSRYYLDAPDGKRALWTEVRDGKGVLLVYDSSVKKDTVLATQSGLTSPLRWLDSRTVIYHVQTPQETADYVVSLDGGSPHKITDVTNVAGLGQWNYGY